MIGRRTLLAALSSGVTVSMLSAYAATGAGQPGIVLVHGAWHGGWCWDRVTPLLQKAGYRVAAPTLPGMAERKTEMSLAIDLDTHIDSVVDVCLALPGPVVLIGHSYGGFVITGAADRLVPSKKLVGMIYLDAFVPANGEMVANYMAPESREKLKASFAAGRPGWAPPPARFFGVVEPADVAFVDSKLADQPGGTYLQPLRLGNPLPPAIKRSYIACNSPRIPVFDEIKSKLAKDSAWQYVELATGHDAMITAPAALAATILRLV